jgi:dienelactone hydrolase
LKWFLTTCSLVGLLGSLALAQPVSDDQRPTTEGLHHLKFDFEYQGDKQRMTYGLYLPRQIEGAVEEGRKLPLFVFLPGAGSRGNSLELVYREGPLLAMKRSEAFAATINYAVMVPQIPVGNRWENPRMGSFVAEATRRVMKRWPIDPQRVYLVGKSMGGEGAWHAGLAGADVFATVTSISGRQHPEPQQLAKALKGRTALIVVGSGDDDFTTGSKLMASVFRKHGVDTVSLVVPGRGHDVWKFYLLEPKFYAWMMLHRRDAPPPQARAGEKEMLRWAINPPGDPKYFAFVDDLQKQFGKFKPYWFVEHSAMVDHAGLQPEALGSKNVFVTHPLNREIPCRIMTTTTIPKDKLTRLHMEVAAKPGEQWVLVVNVDCYRSLWKKIEGRRGRDPRWVSYDVDLTSLAGKKVFIEILNKSAHRSEPGSAYWRKIEIISEDFDAAD